MKWLALLLVVAGAVAVPRLLSDPPVGCPDGYAFSPGPFHDSAYRGEATADEAVAGLLGDAERTTSEETTAQGRDVVVYRGFDADGDLVKKVEIVQHEDGRWYEGASQVCS